MRGKKSKGIWKWRWRWVYIIFVETSKTRPPRAIGDRAETVSNAWSLTSGLLINRSFRWLVLGTLIAVRDVYIYYLYLFIQYPLLNYYFLYQFLYMFVIVLCCNEFFIRGRLDEFLLEFIYVYIFNFFIFIFYSIIIIVNICVVL